MSSILTNNSAMVALDTLRSINKNLAEVQNQISTGKKINSAKDNAAVWAISTVMSTDVSSFNQITDSLNVGSATVGVARSAAETVTGLLQDMKDLIVQAQQDLNTSDRTRIQTDVTSLRTQIGNIVNAAQFNGVNLLKGTSAMSVLASLDRASDGTVSATNISVSRNDLATTAAAAGTAKTSGDGGYVSTADSITATDVAKTAGDPGTITASQAGDLSDGQTLTLTIKAGAINAGDVFSFTVGGSAISYTAVSGDTINDVAAALRTAIDGASITNATAAGGADAADPLVNDATVTVGASGGAVTWADSSITTTYSSSDLQDGNSVDVTLDGGTITAGDTFTVNAGGADYTYTAADGDTNNDVAAGLKALIDAGSITNLTVTVTDATDPTADAATITLAASGGSVAVNLSALASSGPATTAGGLAALSSIDVSTATGATAALSSIETLLNTAISASASFGSAQKQIDAQSEFVMQLVDSMNSGIGAMVDADMEAASAKLQAVQVQQQLGVQSLSIANQSPQVLLNLFR
ncbi:MAG TPA: flagellin [Hyphomonas sp.]|nr:hypothetical protein [Hyphomonas sp.]MCC0017735.1 flagellin [Rhodobiaceae bacterium]HPE46795.1 flagellin [Hyphomonas sp.]